MCSLRGVVSVILTLFVNFLSVYRQCSTTRPPLLSAEHTRVGIPINTGRIIYNKGDDFGLQKCIISSSSAEIVLGLLYLYIIYIGHFVQSEKNCVAGE